MVGSFKTPFVEKERKRMPKRTTGTYGPKELVAIAEQLEEVAASLRALSSSLEILGAETIDIDGQYEMIRGLRGIETFRHKSRLAHQDLMMGKSAENGNGKKRS